MLSTRRVFLKQMGFGVAAATFIPSLPALAEHTNSSMLLRSTPEAEGISSSGIHSFLDAIEKSNIEFHSIMIVRHGKVIAEGWWYPYAAHLKHTLYSLSKSFTSTAVGFAVSEKKFTVDTPVISFFPNDLPAEVSSNLAAMKVKHLLTMSTGHSKDTSPDLRNSGKGNWAKLFLEIPVEYEPGTHFLYNTGATYMQSAIVQKTTGQTLMQYLKPRLFDPLGIEGMDWESDPEGINVGGYGLRVKTEDIAKFGQLYLQKGKWNGKQVVAAEWIAEATSAQIDNSPPKPILPKEENDWSQGYGYQFWRCTHHAVRGDGAFGQFCIMMPEQDVVVAITSESFDLQGSMNLVWKHLLPAISSGSLPDDKPNQNLLEQKLKGLAIAQNKINSTSPTSSRINQKNFALEENPFTVKFLSFVFANESLTLQVQDDKGATKVNCGLTNWIVNENFKTQILFPLPNRPAVTTPVAACASWKDENTLVLILRYTETAHHDNLTFIFDDNTVSIQFLNSVARGNKDAIETRKDIKGKMV